MAMSIEQEPEPIAEVNVGPEVEEFANALDSCLSPFLDSADKRSRILDLPRKYYENAIRRLQNTRPKRARGSYDDVDMDVDEVEAADGVGLSAETEHIKFLEQEIQTWDLIRRLLPLRYTTPGATPPQDLLSTTSASSRHDLFHEFLLTDSIAQERHTVLQWLQSNAASGPDIDEVARGLLKQANRGDIFAHGWLHTRSTIKLRKNMTAWPHLLDRQQPSIMHSHLNTDRAPLVTQLDPDAGTRQGRKLEPADEYFERAVWLGCFEHIRRGSSLAVLRDWCYERTEMWRAVSMSSLLLPADDDVNPDEVSAESLALWRRMCFALSRQGGSDDYERAVYGILSGDVISVEKVAKRWDDFLFANYNALLRTQFDAFVLNRLPSSTASAISQSLSAFDAVQYLGHHEGVEKRLVRSLELQSQTHDEAMDPAKTLQAAIIARDIDRHLYEQGLVVTEDANKTIKSDLLPSTGPIDSNIVTNKYFKLSQFDGLRIITHLYVLIVIIERLNSTDGSASNRVTSSQQSQAQSSILVSYTDFLRRAGCQELIPLYCSVLEPPRQYDALSWNLIHEEDPEQRLLLLRLVKKAGIDVLNFVSKQARRFYEALDRKTNGDAIFDIVRKRTSPRSFGSFIQADFFGDDDEAIVDSHERAIRALEWLLMVDGMWPQVFSMGTKVYKFFLRNAHLRAARRLVERVSFSKVIQGISGQSEGDEILYDDLEYWAQLLLSNGAQGEIPEQVMADARSFRELEALVRALDCLETIASFMVISTELPNGGDRDFWNGVAPVIENTKEFMKPLLKGWLLLAIKKGDLELQELRLTYLPETVLAYICALHFAGTSGSRDNLLECMELASLVAERDSDLSSVFIEAKRMAELVEAFAACGKTMAVVTDKKRPTGSNSKKLREKGWSRDLWSIKSGSSGEASVIGPA